MTSIQDGSENKETFHGENIFVSTSSENKFRKDSGFLKVENLTFDSSRYLKEKFTVNHSCKNFEFQRSVLKKEREKDINLIKKKVEN